MRSTHLNRRTLLVRLALAASVALAFALTGTAALAQRSITVASTTSTQNSGLFGHILPIFKAKTGIDVKVVAVGTGQAIKMAEKGDADVLFVHDKPSELKFMAGGFGVERYDVMYNDFVVVGPKSDPAGVKGGKDTEAAFKHIAAKKAVFISRGDDSGTDKAEKRFWKSGSIDVKSASGGWYRESGQGMGATLNMAAGSDGYALTDRGTWLSFKNRKDLVIVVEGDPALFNQYGITVVNPEKFPHVKKADATAFVSWVISPEGQKAIADYKIDGEQLFFPNYKK